MLQGEMRGMGRLPIAAVSLLAAMALTACNMTQDVLEPSAIAPEDSAASLVSTDMAATAAAATETMAATTPEPTAAAVPSSVKLQFAPLVGPTVGAATPLTDRLARRARQRGIALAGSSDPAVTHVLKGYFSTFSEGTETTVIYVWDVYDPAGNRIHRITGQEKIAFRGKEGWDGVPQSTMEGIADLTVDKLAAWLASGTG